MKKGVLILLIFIFLFSIFIENFKAQSINLTEDSQNYTIENEYYKAVIPKANCIVLELYVKNSTNWSNNLMEGGATFYGLGYLEGRADATGNDASGLQNSCTGMIILENTSAKVKVKGYNNDYGGSNFTETWTFWAKKPYFQSEASVIVTSENSSLNNQFQFCWMINDSLNNTIYMNNESNNIIQPSVYQIQQMHSPNFTNYPWVNWQFQNDSVSLGLIFTDIYDRYGTIGEALAAPFEYQLDFSLGSGLLDNPTKRDYKRAVTTIYYTANRSTNDDIANFTINHYQGASAIVKQNPALQASASVNSPLNQNPGIGSALVNSPYFLVRQNGQNSHLSGLLRTQYQISIYAPIYKYQGTIHSADYDFIDQLTYSLNYDNATNTSVYGNISKVSTNNSDYEVSLQMNATSNDSKLFYSSIFKTGNDSDKLKITGSASNASANASIKEIYVSLAMPSSGRNKHEAESISSPYITSSLVTNDNLWTNYNYGYGSRTILIYRDNTENVPPISIPLFIPDGQYEVVASVLQRPEGNVTYSYSLNNQTWSNFTVQNVTSSSVTSVNLGLKNITNGTFYINDDDNSAAGIAGWAGWDMVTFSYISNLSSTVYDIRLGDAIYEKLGVAVKINSPTNNISIINNSELRIYLYQNASAQNLTNFNYPFDIEIYPHKGWLNDSSQFTGLHSRDILNYTQHIFYVPEGIHTGRTNTIYSSGAVDYSAEPYENSSEINMTIKPSVGSLNVTIINFAAGYKKWTETASNSTATTNHTIGNLNANANYNVKIGGVLWNTYTSNSSGYMTFIYNGGYSTKTFEVEQFLPSPENESVGGYPVFMLNQSQLEKGYRKTLYKEWKIQFEFENETHTIKLKNIVNETAVIIFSSESQTFNLAVNETKKLDLNSDRFYDLQISAENITHAKADLIVKLIYEKVLPELTSSEKASKGLITQLTIFSLFGLVIFIGVVFLIKRIFHRRRHKKRR